VPDALSYDLHELTARLDRAADRILRGRLGISYARFLTLFSVRNGVVNQRELAGWLVQSEPSTSRMVAVLAAEGLLQACRVPGAGNSRHLRLTPAGLKVVNTGSRLLEFRFQELVKRSGVPEASYRRHTRRLIRELEAESASPHNFSDAA
jgi:DNA-binding MarR family transcriptional regulator